MPQPNPERLLKALEDMAGWLGRAIEKASDDGRYRDAARGHKALVELEAIIEVRQEAARTGLTGQYHMDEGFDNPPKWRN